MSEKVKHKVKPITRCSYCGGEVKYVCNDEIYGKQYGKWPYAYLCQTDSCRAYVGVHPNSKIPLGTLADRATREARKRHKPDFITMQKKLGLSRNQAYKWLSEALSIDPSKTHWGMFDVETCERAGQLCRKRLNDFIREKTARRKSA